MKNFFRYTYRSEIVINAPKEIVWQALTDFDAYSTWNPFTIRIDSSWELGSEVFLTLKTSGENTMVRTEYLKAYDKPEKLVWGFTYRYFLKAERTQTLIALDEKTTRYENVDIIKGLITPIVHIFYGKWVQRGFDSLVLALKEFIENHEPKN